MMAISLALALAAALAAQEAGTVVRADKRVQERTYVFAETGRTIPYALFVPSTYSASKKWLAKALPPSQWRGSAAERARAGRRIGIGARTRRSGYSFTGRCTGRRRIRSADGRRDAHRVASTTPRSARRERLAL